MPAAATSEAFGTKARLVPQTPPRPMQSATRLLSSALFLAVHLFWSLCTVTAATYYVSPGGNDAANGLSPSSPWRTVAKVNSIALQAGDRVLFEGGATFTDQGVYLTTNDLGTAENPVVIGSYGNGRARIKPSSDAYDPVFIYNVAGVVIENLILEGVGRDTSTQSGVHIYTDLPGNQRLRGVTVRHCEISQVQTGVELGAWTTDGSFSGFDSVLIEHLLVHTCRRDGIYTYGYYPGTSTHQSHRDVVIRDCEVRHVTGDPTKTNNHSGSGIIMSGVKRGLIDRCYAHHNGGSGGNNSGGGPVGIWTWGSDSVTIQRSLVHDQKTKPGVKDGGGFDIDGGATNAVIQYCYSYNNDGPGFLVAEFDHAPPLANATFRYNISWRDGRRVANAMASGFHFWKGAGSASTISNVEVHNNLVYTENATGGPAVVWQDGAMSGLRFRNNIFIVSGGERFVEVNNNTARGYFTFRNNAYWAVDGNWSGGWLWGSGTVFNTLAGWRGATGAPETHAGQAVGFDVDPRISAVVQGAQPTSVDDLANIAAFRLLADSPLRDTAHDLRLPVHGALSVGTRDFFGLPLPAGAGFDVGPHERVAPVALIDGALYELEPMGALGKRLQVAQGVDANGTNVRIWSADQSPAQRWRLSHVGGGAYELTPACALARRLDVNQASSANGANIHVWESNGSSAQRWQAHHVESDIYELEPLCAPGKRLDLSGGGSADGTNVHLWQSFGITSQRWRMIRVPSSTPLVSGGIYELAPQNAPALRLNVNGAADANGANVQTWTANGGDAQGWRLTEVGNDLYELAPFCAIGRRLDLSGGGTGDGTNVHIWQSFGIPSQRWKLIDLGEDLYELEPATALGRRLDVTQAGTAPGTNVQILQSNGGAAQKWRITLRHAFVPIVSGATYELAPLCAPGNRLDVNGAADTNGANVQTWTANQGAAQGWRVDAVGGGFHELAPLCALTRRLEVQSAGSADGTNVQIWQASGGTGQRWKLIHLGGPFYELEPQCAPEKRLDVSGISPHSGANVHLWSGLGTAGQRWRLIAR